MSKAKDLRDAAKQYAAETKRAWRETSPQSSKDVRKLEAESKNKKK